MKTMIKKTMAALAALTAMTACTSENDFTEPVSDVKTYQVNIHASFDGATTRAVTFDGTASSSTFASTEKVYVYNATRKQVMLNADGTAAGYLTPTNISADGKSCDLTGTLTGTITATDQLLLMYNLNEVEDGNDNNRIKTYSDFDYNWQDGTATGVTDGATATMTGWSIDGGVLTTTGTAQFQNVQSMFRFSFKDNAIDDDLSVKQVYITSQNNALVRSYYPMRDEASRYSKGGVGMFTDQALSGYVYMALCIDEASSAADVLTFKVTDGDGNKYEGTKAAPADGFRNGKYYHSSAPIALTLKERRIMPTITWTTPSSAPETIGEEMIEIEDDNADFALSGTSEGVCFLLVQNGTVRLNGLTASYGADNFEFIEGNYNITLDISGANSIATRNYELCILACDNLKLQGYGTLTVTANDPTQCGIRGNDNYAPANSWQSETNANATTDEIDVSDQLAATGYKVIRSARTDNADGTYTWTYTVYPATLNLATVAADVTIYDGMTLSGTLSGHQLLIADGATVTLSGASVTGPEGYDYGAIRCLGDATIILADGTENTAQSGSGNKYAAVSVPEGKTLTINGGSAGTGKLTADARVDVDGNSKAGIGGGEGISCGKITITGGTVTAYGNNTAAGIGGGDDAYFDDITITGGTVTATGGQNVREGGAGIGCHAKGSGVVGSGSITISGGTVTATGGGNAAGIGTGRSGICGGITIGSGIISVTATKGADGYPEYLDIRCIGKGKQGNAGTVKIDGQTITDYMFMKEPGVDVLPSSFDSEEDYNDYVLDYNDCHQDLPTFPNLTLDGNKYSQTWTLTKK